MGCFETTTPIVWCDNLSATDLTTNPIFHSLTKHMGIDFHFIHEKVKKKSLVVRYLSTHYQVADVLTKALSKARFQLFRDKLIMSTSPFNLQGSVTDRLR